MAKLEKLIGEVLDGKYHLDRLLGQGGMGAVFLATHLGTTRPVALKVIAPQFMTNEEVGERFRREAEAAGRLRHPNVVNVTDFGVAEVGSDTLAYLVMEYLDGASLGELIKQRGAMPLPLVVDIVEQICLAIGNAHQQGIIHRDLKPDNILLQPDQRGGYIVKVLDFGLAKLRDSSSAEEAAEKTAEEAKEEADGRPARLTINTTHPQTAKTTHHQGEEINFVATQVPAPITTFGEEVTRIQMPDGGDLEAATLIQPATSNSDNQEAATRIFAPAEDVDSAEETATQIQLPEDTRASLSPKTTRDSLSQKTTSASGVGLTSSTSVELTRIGSILGTPLYMSPEQCQGDALDARSDIYSLGVIVYQMLTGETPFTGSMTELMAKHCDTPPPSVKEKRKNIPDAVARLVMAALEKNPAARPATAERFATALRAMAATEVDLLRQAKAFYYSAQRQFFIAALVSYLPCALLSVSLSLLLSSWLSSSPAAAIAFYLFLYALILLATRVNLAFFALILQTMKMSQTASVEIKAVLSKHLSNLPSLLPAIAMAYGKTLMAPFRLSSPVQAHLDSSLVTPVMAVEGQGATAALAHSKRLVDPVRSLVKVGVARDFGICLVSLVLFPCIVIIMVALFAGTTALAFALDIVMVPTIRTFTAGYIWFILLLMHTVYSAMPLAILYFKARQAQGEKLDEGVAGEWQQSDVHKRTDKMGKATLVWFVAPFVLLVTAAILSLVGAVNSASGSLIDAITQGRSETVRRMLASGRNPNEGRMGNHTALMYAAKEGQLEILEALLQAGAALETRDRDGDTALSYAAADNRVEAVQALLAAGANHAAQNHDGRTALMLAARKGRLEVVQVLLAAGAAASVKDKDGKTAQQYAEEEGHSDVARLLQEAGTKE